MAVRLQRSVAWSRRDVLRGGVGLALAAGAGVALPSAASAQAVELPAGRLRQGTIAVSTVAPIAVELGLAFAARLGVPQEVVAFPTDAGRLDAILAGQIDLANIAGVGAFADLLDFSPPILLVDATYMVAGNAAIRRVADADRPGVRVAAVRAAAIDLFLTRHLKEATLVRSESLPDAVGLLRSGQVDAVAALRTNLIPLVAQVPGSRLLDDAYDVQESALGVPKGRPTLFTALRAFVAHAVASGQVAQVLARANFPGVRAAGGAAAPAQLPRTGGVRVPLLLGIGAAAVMGGLAARRGGSA